MDVHDCGGISRRYFNKEILYREIEESSILADHFHTNEHLTYNYNIYQASSWGFTTHNFVESEK